MRIEIIKPIAPLDQERYVFIVRVDSLAIRAHLVSYRREYRESTRHRTWHLSSAWYEDERQAKALPLEYREAKQPDLPYSVYKDMRRNLEKAIKYNFEVNHVVGEPENGVRN